MIRAGLWRPDALDNALVLCTDNFVFLTKQQLVACDPTRVQCRPHRQSAITFAMGNAFCTETAVSGRNGGLVDKALACAIQSALCAGDVRPFKASGCTWKESSCSVVIPPMVPIVEDIAEGCPLIPQELIPEQIVKCSSSFGVLVLLESTGKLFSSGR